MSALDKWGRPYASGSGITSTGRVGAVELLPGEFVAHLFGTGSVGWQVEWSYDGGSSWIVIDTAQTAYGSRRGLTPGPVLCCINITSLTGTAGYEIRS